MLQSDATELDTWGKVHICHGAAKKNLNLNLDRQDKIKKKQTNCFSPITVSLLRCNFCPRFNISVSLHSFLISQRFVDLFPCQTAWKSPKSRWQKVCLGRCSHGDGTQIQTMGQRLPHSGMFSEDWEDTDWHGAPPYRSPHIWNVKHSRAKFNSFRRRADARFSMEFRVCLAGGNAPSPGWLICCFRL